jgi:Flp pilus assembly protein TadG
MEHANVGFAGATGFVAGLVVWLAAQPVGRPLAALAAAAAAGAVCTGWHVAQFGSWRDPNVIPFAAFDAGAAAALGCALIIGGGASHPEVWLPKHELTWLGTAGLLFAGGWILVASARRAGRGPLRRGEEGSAAVELVLLTPLLVALVGLAVIGGRISKADGEVQGAARAAARAASMQRSSGAAQSAADQAAQTELQGAGVTCGNYTLQLVPGPAGGVDRATLTCVVPLADLSWTGMTASKTVVATSASPVDPYRQSQ